MKSGFLNHKSRMGAVGMRDLLFLILLFFSMIVGIKYGIRIGAKYGNLLAVVGGVAGSVLGVGFSISVMFLAALFSWPFEAFSKWWRPYPPPCQNKSCSSKDYLFECLPEDIIQKHSGFSPIGWRCKNCGKLYASLDFDRWVRILPDGDLKPYLRHKPFRRWQRDLDTDFTPSVPMSDETFFSLAGSMALFIGILALFLSRYLKYEWIITLGIVGTVCGAFLLLLVVINRISVRQKTIDKSGMENVDKSEEQSYSKEGNIPGWLLPWIMSLGIGGTAFLTLFFLCGLKDSISRWMVAGCAAFGFVGGAIAWGVLSLKERKIDRIGPVSFAVIGDVIKFFGVKLIALIPGAISLGVWVAPLPDQSMKERICVSLITGGLFLLGFFIDGLSFSQYRRDAFTGINLHCCHLAKMGFILTIVGFVIGIVI